MLGTAAAFALFWAMAFPAQAGVMEDPVSYEAAVAAGVGAESTPASDEGSDSGASVLSPEQQALMAADPRWTARVNLYHAGGGGATGNDSLGCRPIAMRTIATDPRYIPRRPYVLHLHGTDIRTLWSDPVKGPGIQTYIDGAAHVYYSTRDNEENATTARGDAEYMPVFVDPRQLPEWSPQGYVAFASR